MISHLKLTNPCESATKSLEVDDERIKGTSDLYSWKYRELFHISREYANLYFKATALVLAVLGIAIGYALEAKINTLYARIALGLIVVLIWLIGGRQVWPKTLRLDH